MIKVFKDNKMFKFEDYMLEKICVEISGGGLTALQTATAMQYAQDLRINGELSLKGYEIKLVGDL
jgi:hypothetical protein